MRVFGEELVVVVGPQVFLGGQVQHQTPLHHHERPDESDQDARLDWQHIGFVIDFQEKVEHSQC